MSLQSRKALDGSGSREDVPNLKILLIGNSSVGKSSLLLRFASSTFLPPDEATATIGVDFKVKTIYLTDNPQPGPSRGGRKNDGLGQDGDPQPGMDGDEEDGYDNAPEDIAGQGRLTGRKVKLSIWDTAGQERFRVLTGSYYRGAMGVVLVYDISSRDSFEELVRWLREIETYCVPAVKRLLVGNKVDREFSRQVSSAEGRQFADQMNMGFLECSAMSDTGVDDIFDKLARSILADGTLVSAPQRRREADTIDLQDEAEEVRGGSWSGCAC